MISDLVHPWWTAPRPVGAAGPLRRDWVLVVVIYCVALLEGLLRADVRWRGIALATALVLALLLPWRRVHPLAALATALGVSSLLGIAGWLAHVPPQDIGLYTTAFVLLLPYALFRWGSGREVVSGAVIILIADGLSIAKDHPQPSDVIGGFVVLALSALLGVSARFLSTARARELEQVRFRERELLARELHDMVAHHVSAMVIRAQAGRVLAGSQPDAAVDALKIIEVEGSRTLAEMRTMVGALRAGDDAELTPLAGLAEIEGLASRGAEQPAVLVALSGVPGDVSPAVGAALFRIAQEGVTNARRHARHASRIQVRVTGQGGLVRLTVRDDGDPVAAARAPDGYGIVGMTERAKLLGGTLTAGPADDRGWLVEAVLPRTGATGATGATG
ncbi:MAG TPA: histidine kinase [Kineosporiaceae bacterium]|nr:histidine kinase [Kineosporiaceae bacterium]